MVARAPESELREVVHQRVRLGVLALLDRRGPCTFSELRDLLAQSDGGLGRHLSVLEEHGYVRTEKVFENRRPRTWVHLTPPGVRALEHELELLAKLVARTSNEAEQGDNPIATMTIVFAALFAEAEIDSGAAHAQYDELPLDRVDRSILVPAAPALTGRHSKPHSSGSISARFEFPAGYPDFAERRILQMTLMSHGLQGGWTTTWHILPAGDDDRVVSTEPGTQDTAHAVVVELGSAADCTSILAIMGPPTVQLPDLPAVRGYLLPSPAGAVQTTATAWFAVGAYLVSTAVVLSEADNAVPALRDLVTAVHGAVTASLSQSS
ncbi:transcriptional regulator [Mycobacterium sp. 852013-50091_SCH5140682]|uniref:transcriptional regulator n=1 Tax=Mycobacterium sp. 852013-50091_SCH5140682 TaxID=1834109 RepID=UPI0009ED6216|nr:transcriptional regulator [Mycobacterium sp. 852013-50091_SCH5140682]